MEYILKHRDTPLLVFEVRSDFDIPEIEIITIYEEHRTFLPLGLTLSNQGLASWIRHRIMTKYRAHASLLMDQIGCSIYRPMAIVAKTKALSLEDCFWIVPKTFKGFFIDHNSYDHRFDQGLASCALFGEGKASYQQVYSAEYTTHGTLAKCWKRSNHEIILYKQGRNYEVYSEYYASQLAKHLGINCVDYELHKVYHVLCCTCQIFTSKEVSFVEAGKLASSMSEVYRLCEQLGEQYSKSLKEMVVFDAIIANTDRHLYNFGFLVDNETNEIKAMAPLFDHGNSLLFDCDSIEEMKKYQHVQYPRLYDDFIKEARACLDLDLKERLKKMQTVQLENHARYHVEKKRLTILSRFVQERIKEILEES